MRSPDHLPRRLDSSPPRRGQRTARIPGLLSGGIRRRPASNGRGRSGVTGAGGGGPSSVVSSGGCCWEWSSGCYWGGWRMRSVSPRGEKATDGRLDRLARASHLYFVRSTGKGRHGGTIGQMPGDGGEIETFVIAGVREHGSSPQKDGDVVGGPRSAGFGWRRRSPR